MDGWLSMDFQMRLFSLNFNIIVLCFFFFFSFQCSCWEIDAILIVFLFLFYPPPFLNPSFLEISEYFIHAIKFYGHFMVMV